MTAEERITKLEADSKAMTAKIEKLKEELAEKDKSETVWTPKNKEDFLCIYARGSVVTETYYDTSTFGNDMLSMNDIFKPTRSVKKHLYWYRDNVLRVQNKLMQLHELLCPDYFPDWGDDDEPKFYLYNYKRNAWECSSRLAYCDHVVYFTQEAAKKACEILNREKFMMK